MDGFWKKARKVAGFVVGIGGVVLAAVIFFRSPGKTSYRPRHSAPPSWSGPTGGDGIWFVGRGETFKPGSWGSGRHR